MKKHVKKNVKLQWFSSQLGCLKKRGVFFLMVSVNNLGFKASRMEKETAGSRQRWYVRFVMYCMGSLLDWLVFLGLGAILMDKALYFKNSTGTRN